MNLNMILSKLLYTHRITILVEEEKNSPPQRSHLYEKESS